MDFITSILKSDVLVLKVVLITGLGLAAGFILFFLLPSLVLLVRLTLIRRKTKRCKPGTTPGELQEIFRRDTRLLHLWHEYAETLHDQKELQDGEWRITAYRATIPSETYFNQQYIVDSRIFADFFKHVPGIFTGLGIIGTFAGLIDGLNQFRVSEDATTVRASLEVLMHSVGHAFVVSASAIGLAMLATLLEKFLLTLLGRVTEGISHDIDACFDAGAGEEYLSRLVNASEESASQARILKDALVRELGDILERLTKTQIAYAHKNQQALIEKIEQSASTQAEAVQQQASELGSAISNSIATSLQDPLDRIASIVERASGDQSDTAARALESVMSGFGEKLNELFGGQIMQINEASRDAGTTMKEAADAIKAMVEDLRASGREGAEATADAVTQAITQMESRQARLNEEIGAIVGTLKESLASLQDQSSQALTGTLEAIHERLEKSLGIVGNAQAHGMKAMVEAQKSHGEQVTQQVEQLSGSIQTSIDNMTTKLDLASSALGSSASRMSESVAEMKRVTVDGGSSLSAATSDVANAAKQISDAGTATAATLSEARSLQADLKTVAAGMAESSRSLAEAMKDYRAQRESISQMMERFESSIARATEGAEISREIVSQIEQAASHLKEARDETDRFLGGVTDVLGQSAEAFQSALIGTLGSANTEYQKHLAGAVGMLAQTVEDLESQIAAAIPDR